MDKDMMLAMQAAAHQDEQTKKAQAISLIARIKPFFVEFTFYGGWGDPDLRGVINGAHIQSVVSVHPKKPQKGTNINYVFGGVQRVVEPLDDVVTALKAAASQIEY
jgi:hypothetical protein